MAWPRSLHEKKWLCSCASWGTRPAPRCTRSRASPWARSACAVRRSFATWAAVTCSNLTFPEVPPASTDRHVGYVQGGTNQNLVLWRTASCASAVPAGDPCRTQGGCSNKYDCWDGDSGAIATTTTTAGTSTGEILDADIELNDFGFAFTNTPGPPC